MSFLRNVYLSTFRNLESAMDRNVNYFPGSFKAMIKMCMCFNSVMELLCFKVRNQFNLKSQLMCFEDTGHFSMLTCNSKGSKYGRLLLKRLCTRRPHLRLALRNNGGRYKALLKHLISFRAAAPERHRQLSLDENVK